MTCLHEGCFITLSLLGKNELSINGTMTKRLTRNPQAIMSRAFILALRCNITAAGRTTFFFALRTFQSNDLT